MRRRWAPAFLAGLQALLGARVVWRLLRTAGGESIAASGAPCPDGERVSVIVPVLNERARLAPCLRGLVTQTAEVAEILVVDGGSSDGTQELVAAHAALDARIRLLDASPIPPGRNGKAHGLQVGLAHAAGDAAWILTMDADVRPVPALTRSLLAHAGRTGVAMLSVATRQRLSGRAEGLVHPALLTTLVYRFGIPGHATRNVAAVQANGQCCLIERATLERLGGFAVASASLCEDVTLARAFAANGHAVGFYEADRLVAVEMYGGWREAWRQWPRSLPLRDQFSGLAGWIGLLEVTLVQALPLPLLLALAFRDPSRRPLKEVSAALALVRLGVVVGTARAYIAPPWTYWLSPLADLPVAFQLWGSALRRRHEWRGRIVVRGAEGESA